MSGLNEPKTIPELFFNRVQISPSSEALRYKKAGTWWPVTWKAYEQSVREVAQGMADWVQPKDIVCILSENRPEWGLAYLAVLATGAVVVPLDAQLRDLEVGEILASAEVTHAVSDARHLPLLSAARAARRPALRLVCRRVPRLAPA